MDREVTKAMENITNMKNVLSLKQEEVRVLTDAVSTSNVLFKTGYTSCLEVITAQCNVLEAELQLVHTKESMYLSFIDLYRSLRWRLEIGNWTIRRPPDLFLIKPV